MKVLKHKCFVVIAVLMSLMVFAAPVLAQQGDITAGLIAGEQAARSNTSGMLWMFVGCTGNLVLPGGGVIAAYLYEPTPSATQLLGKSPDYVIAYTDAYKAAAKKVQTRSAWTGCTISALLYAAIIALAIYSDPDRDLM